MATEYVLVIDSDPARAATIAALLENKHPPDGRRSVAVSLDPNAPIACQTGVPTLAVIVVGGGSEESRPSPGPAELARKQGLATLAVVDLAGDPSRVAREVESFDDWVALDAIGRELPIRVAGLLRQAGSPRSVEDGGVPVDPHLLSVMIHDLRTPLNVIMLTIRAIAQTVPQRSAELDEDLTFLKENAWQIERMLAQLVEYGKVNGPEARASAVEFDPRRFLGDFVEVYRSKAGAKAPQIHLEIASTCPTEVAVDPTRALVALQQAMNNASIAAGTSPVKLRSSGNRDRWVVELVVDKSPPEKVESIALRPNAFERLEGAAGERRGLDLAIASRVSEMFGGSARLVVETGKRSTILLDWPQRLAGA